MSEIKPLWNEELCFKYATKFLINPSLRNAEDQRNVMRRFIDFYCWGWLKPGFSTKTVILDAVYLLTDDDDKYDLCWRKEFYEESVKDFGDSDYELSSTNPRLQFRRSFPELKDRSRHLSCFRTEITNILSSVTSNFSFYLLRRYVSFLAITFLASVIKSENELREIFSHYAAQRITVSRFGQDNPPPIPCRFAIAKACEIKREEFKSALAKIILEYNKAQKNYSEMCYYLNNSCLSFIYNYSLEMFSIINDVCNKYKLNCNTLYDLTNNLSTKLDPHLESIMTLVLNSWENFRKYFEKYKSEKGEWFCFPDETFHYAVVFVENNIFSDLSVDRNKELYDVLKYCLHRDDLGHSSNIPDMEIQSNVDEGVRVLKEIGKLLKGELVFYKNNLVKRQR